MRTKLSRLMMALTMVVVGVVVGWPRVGAAQRAAPNATSLPVRTSVHSLVVDGLTRSYRVYRPAAVTGDVPLVVTLHGGFGSGEQAEKSYGWDAEADQQHFVVAYPDGLHRAWNTGGGCCGQPAAMNVDDVGFIRALIDDIAAKISLDHARIYATGISNGGIMSYTLACQTTIFAAIGPDSATMLGPCPDPAPLSVIHIHGTADTRIPYQGGQGDGTARIDGPAIPAVNAKWRSIDHCTTPSITTHGPVTTSVAVCPAGRSVELITIAGAGHQWPGGAPKPPLQQVLQRDPPSTALDATSVIWQFFAAHPK